MSFGGRTNQADSTAIAGDGWPDLSTGEFRNIRRVSTVFDNDSIAMAISIAALNVQGQLVTLLVDGNPPELTAAKKFTYKRAVYGLAHAELLPEFATQDQRAEANNAATDEPEQSDRFLSQARRDICLLLNRSPNGIASI
ncbi:head completion/stabilization protein [Photobacterium sp. OFAV2-7]|uniref:head completion/stabilization protein n=1 Tax=Photobacterium sp. OFAV2-7 TaxID=2917748 RepID=UPI001EF721D1|nr:head completion/stabilization protein [Photobacterium sp. OFAV2-7]MCG7585665.1 head completion/stabilization protein [Photobacterium sp. OFAV2-7]